MNVERRNTSASIPMQHNTPPPTDKSDKTSLMTKYAIDFVAAGTASLCVSPFITIVDRSIIENASGARPLKQGLKELFKDFVSRPHQFIQRREFLLIYGLYSATYITANIIDTTCEEAEQNNQWPKFLGTTAVNMSLCIAKDRAFTRMFGVIAPTKLPLSTYALFAARDSLTVAASFSAPSVVSKQFQERGYSPSASDKSAQMLCPAAVQFISTPMHLLGLDLYNHVKKAPADRMNFIAKEYFKSAFARIARIGPAFGIGCIGNKYARDTLRERLL